MMWFPQIHLEVKCIVLGIIVGSWKCGHSVIDLCKSEKKTYFSFKFKTQVAFGVFTPPFKRFLKVDDWLLCNGIESCGDSLPGSLQDGFLRQGVSNRFDLVIFLNKSP